MTVSVAGIYLYTEVSNCLTPKKYKGSLFDYFLSQEEAPTALECVSQAFGLKS